MAAPESKVMLHHVSEFLIKERYLLSALELLHELKEACKADEAQILEDFFSNEEAFPVDTSIGECCRCVVANGTTIQRMHDIQMLVSLARQLIALLLMSQMRIDTCGHTRVTVLTWQGRALPVDDISFMPEGFVTKSAHHAQHQP